MVIRRETFRDVGRIPLAYISEFVGPLLRVCAQRSVVGRPSAPGNWKRGVLLGADHIGDVLFRTSSLPTLNRELPQCSWHFVAQGAAREVLETNPHLAGVHDTLGQAVKAVGVFDVAICYDTAQYWKSLLASIEAGIPNRVAYVHKGFSAWVTHPQPIRFPNSFPFYFRDIVANLAGLEASWELRPQVFTTQEDEEKALALHKELGTDTSVGPVLAAFITSRQPHGLWPRQDFAAALSELQRRVPALRILLCGSEDESGILHDFRAEAQLKADVIAGKLRVRELVAFLRSCSAILSPDSGPRHLGNAAEVPVFFISNLSVRRSETGEYCDGEKDLSIQDPCGKGILPPTPYDVACALEQALLKGGSKCSDDDSKCDFHNFRP